MRRFLLKLAAFLAFLFIMVRLPEVFLPWWWGNRIFSQKMEFLVRTRPVCDTYFFGSSLTYRHVDPLLFDRLAAEGGNATRSFNLGAPATTNPELFYLYERFLEEDLPGTRYVLMELGKVAGIHEKDLHTSRSKYFLGLNYYIYAVRGYGHSAAKPEIRKMHVSRYTVSFLERLVNLAMIQDMLSYDGKWNEKHLGSSRNGYFPLQEELGMDRTGKMRRRKDLILEEPERVEGLRDASVLAYSGQVPMTGPNPVVLEKLLYLIRISGEKGIQLVFYIPPRQNLYHEELPLLLALPEKNRIEAASALDYPELYTLGTTFDWYHLNTKGSRLFTGILAARFLEIAGKGD